MLQHPNIWKFSAILSVINAITLTACIVNPNVVGIVINTFFLLFNLTALVGNLLIREHRVKMQEEMKVTRRQELIQFTIGE
jgi:hypothetical protein